MLTSHLSFRFRMYESHLDTMTNGHEDQDVIRENISEDDPSVRTLPPAHSRPTIHWGPVIAGDINGKEQINTDTDHFDALFARSNGSPPLHPRCYSSGSSVVVPTLSPTSTSAHLSTKSQPLPSSSPASKQKHTYEPINESTHRQPSVLSSSSSLASAQAKRKNFSLTHASQTFHQASHSQTEQLEPLARSCSYKRPQSMKKYRQKKKEKEQQQFPARKSSTTPTPPDCSRKSIVATTARVSATDLMATTNDPQDQWSSPKTQRAERVGELLAAGARSILTPSFAPAESLVASARIKDGRSTVVPLTCANHGQRETSNIEALFDRFIAIGSTAAAFGRRRRNLPRPTISHHVERLRQSRVNRHSASPSP